MSTQKMFFCFVFIMLSFKKCVNMKKMCAQRKKRTGEWEELVGCDIKATN